MTHRVPNLLTLVSLLLCVAGAALWVRAQGHRDVLAWSTDQGDGYVLSSPGPAGGLEGTVRRVAPADGSARRLTLRSTPRFIFVRGSLVGIPTTTLGFGADRFAIDIRTARGTERMNWSGVVVPYWAAVIAPGALPAIRGCAWVRRRMRGARAAGLCPACGYDLRATPDQCPECGTTISVATTP